MFRKKTKLEKEEIKKIKNICDVLQTDNAIHEWLDHFYERITNKEVTQEQLEKYDLFKIVKEGKEKARWEYTTTTNDELDHTLVFELYNYSLAPQNFLLIYNQFIDEQQTQIDFYTLKLKGEKENGKENHD